MHFDIDVHVNSAQEIMRRHGLTANGDVQRFHTMNVNRRIGKYMPHLSGAMETKLKRISSNTEIIIFGPYAQYQFRGMAMKGKAPRELSGKPLNYTKSFNPKAGPYWDRALVATEGPAMEADLQDYIDRRG